MARVRLTWVWLIALMVAVMAGCGGDDSQTDPPPDARVDTRTDTPVSDVRTDTDARSDATTDTPPMMDVRVDPPTDTVMPPRPDADATPPPPVDVRPDTVDVRRPDADATPPPPPDADATPPPPPDADGGTPPPPDAPDASVCTNDNQCPANRPHCNTTTGQCVSVTALAVTPESASVALGLTQQYTATVTYSDNSTGNVSSTATWTSSNQGVATVSNTGLATSLTVGSSTITATLGALSDTGALTVTAKQLVSVGITPNSPSNPVGTTRQFTATAGYSDSTTEDVTATATWASATTSVATINSAGLATAVAVGTSEISAAFGGRTGTTTLTVTNATLVSLAVTPQGATMAPQSARQFTLTGTYTDNSTQNLTAQATWTSSAPSVATVSSTAGSIGLVTSVGAGSTTISATYLANPAVTSTLTVTGATLMSINVSPPSPTVAKGLVVPFIATGVYNDSSTATLTTLVNWTSSDTNVAVVSNTAGSQGFATAVNPGPSTITATLGAVSGTAAMTVTNATLTGISISPTNPSIAKGTTRQFTATGTYTDFSTQDITASVLWGSTNAAVGPISNAAGSQGLATGSTVGTTTISATLSGITQTTTLTVTNATLVTIGVTPTTQTIARGNSIQFTAIGTYTDLTTQNLTTTVGWSSSDTAIATISSAAGTEGLANGANIGQVTITAAIGTTGGSTTLTVTAAQLNSIALTPPAPSIAKGTTQQFTATGSYSDGTTQDLTELASWSSSNGTFATVSNAAGTRGLATGRNVGSATITANYLSVSGFTTLTVTAATLNSIAVTPTNVSVPAGTTQQYQATGTYSDNTTQNLTNSVAWDSSDVAVATISSGGGTNGEATTLIAGTTTITATLGLVSGQTTLTVTAAVLQSVQITPTNPSIPRGTTQQFVATGTYSDNTTQNVTEQATWSSSMGTIATISNAAGSRGLATGANAGTTTITATFDGVSGNTLLTVTNATLTSIAVTPATPSIAAGTTLQFTAIGTYSDSTTENLTDQVTWTATGSAAASISNAAGSEGLATAASVGAVTITATFVATSTAGTTTLTVTNATLQSITITPAAPGIARGTTQQFTATGNYSDSTTQNLTNQVTWGSLNTGVATISNAVGTEGLATGVAAGTAGITAAFNSVSGTASITVSSATLTGISVTPQNSNVAAGATVQYTAIGSYSDSTTQNITQLVTWASSVPAAATISNAAGSIGLATGVATGATVISATMSAQTGNSNLNVTP